jgi:hypothetical protein
VLDALCEEYPLPDAPKPLGDALRDYGTRRSLDEAMGPVWPKQYLVSDETLEKLRGEILLAQYALESETYGLLEMDLRAAAAILDKIKGKE